MSLVDWFTNTSQRIRREGLSALSDSISLLYNGAWRIGGSRLPLGKKVYDRDWDLLVLLDGCRVDTLREVAAQESRTYEDNVGRLRSVGSTSREWLAKTFHPTHRDAIRRTAYVTANPYSEEILASSSPSNRSPFNPANWPTVTQEEFMCVEEVWRDSWKDELGTTPPRPVTNRAISTAREADFDRFIVHYMQPHQPFIGERARADGDAWVADNCWTALRQGEVSEDRVRTAYRENLSVVLDDVDLLLENVDADTAVISADHGNAFGEWGIYGHPNGFLHPCVKDVPWVETTATDERTHEPADTSEDRERVTDANTEERLRSLGYL